MMFRTPARLLFGMLVVFTAGCSSPNISYVSTASPVWSLEPNVITWNGLKSDMTDYEGLSTDDHMFVNSDVQDFLNGIENDETFVEYFGFSSCPYCNAVIQILENQAEDFNQKIRYVDTRANEEENNMQIPDYDQFVEAVGSYLEYDEDGNKHLYTPMVFFVKNGEVKKVVTLPEDYDDASVEMTDEQKEYMNEQYEEGFSSLQQNACSGVTQCQ